jgi:hypothetical protein
MTSASILRAGPAFALLLGVFVACGGGAATGADGITKTCPALEPTLGEPCPLPEGYTCRYGSCCNGEFPTGYLCTGSVWERGWADCAPPKQCPYPDAPKDGDACDTCFDPSPCDYTCPGSSQGSVEVSCTAAGKWSVVLSCPP